MASLTSSILLAGYSNRAASIVAGTPQDANFPAANLLGGFLSSRWRSPVGTVSAVKLQFDLGGLQTDIDHVILHGVNLDDAATCRVRIATALTALTGGAGTVTADSGSRAAFDLSLPPLVDYTPPWGRTLIYLPGATVLGAFVEIELTDAGVALGQLEGSAIQVGPSWQPGKSFQPDWGMPDAVVGQPGLEKLTRKHKLTLGRVTVAESVQILSLCRRLKRTGRLYVLPQPLKPATWLSEVVLATIESYAWSAVPLLPNYRSIAISFAEVDD